MTAKTRAIPSLHRDYFLAEVSGSCRCSRRVTQPPFIAGPLAHIISYLQPSRLAKINLFLLSFQPSIETSPSLRRRTFAPSLEKFAFYESTLLMYRDLAIAQLINSP